MAQNDTRAYGELIRRHQSQIRNFLRKLTRDEALADDLSQDVFMHAWKKIQTYTGQGSFIGWLLKIAYTSFLQSKRKSDRYAEVLTKVAREDIRHHTAKEGELNDLEKFLAVLSEQERAVMILSYACGQSHREIGDTTGLPVGTVKSIIHRAKDRIRDEFDIQHHQHG